MLDQSTTIEVKGRERERREEKDGDEYVKMKAEKKNEEREKEDGRWSGDLSELQANHDHNK